MTVSDNLKLCVTAMEDWIIMHTVITLNNFI